MIYLVNISQPQVLCNEYFAFTFTNYTIHLQNYLQYNRGRCFTKSVMVNVLILVWAIRNIVGDILLVGLGWIRICFCKYKYGVYRCLYLITFETARLYLITVFGVFDKAVSKYTFSKPHFNRCTYRKIPWNRSISSNFYQNRCKGLTLFPY